MKSETIYIYGLVCPIERQIKYIGRSIQPKIRLQQHYFTKDNKDLRNWLIGLSNNNLFPKIKILQKTKDENVALLEEMRLINTTPNLFNKAKFDHENYQPNQSNKEYIMIKPQPKNYGLKKKLKELADKSTSPSLNNYLETELLKLVKK